MNRSELFQKIDACPICSTKEIKHFESKVETFIEIFQENIDSHYAYCSSCDFSFMTNPPTDELMGKYYEGNEKLRRSTIMPLEAKHIHQQALIIKEHIENSSSEEIKVLEIGANQGALISMVVSELGPRCKGYFDELNQECVNELSSLGFINHRENGSKEKYDAIILSHTFEHIVMPLDFMKYLKSICKENGIIFIEVPDYSVVQKSTSHDFMFEHVNYYTLGSMQEIAKKSGLIIENAQFVVTKGYIPDRGMRVVFRKVDFVEENYNQFENWNKFMSHKDNVYKNIADFIRSQSQKRIAIYGGGTLTRELLALQNLKGVDIKIFDIDKRKTGSKLYDFTIYHNEEIQNENFDIIVLMVAEFENEAMSFLDRKNIERSKITTYFQLESEV